MNEYMLLPFVLIGGVGVLLLYWRGSFLTFVLTALLFLLFGLFSVAYHVADYFTGEGITDAVLFHLVAGPEGADIWDFMDLLVQTGAALTILLVWLGWAVWRFRKQHKQPTCLKIQKPFWRQASMRALLAPMLASVSLAAHPAVIDGMTLWSQFYTEGEHSDIAEFVKPIKLESKNGKRKNLVYLYLESVERTFFDEKKFPGLIVHLRALEKSSVSFQGLLQAPMTGWTIAGMTASQCGIPMSTFNVGRNAMGERDQFLPGATCLGDVLKNEGYHLAYVGGADLAFAGKGNFYRTHQFDEVMGAHELDVMTGGKLPKSKWGIYDDTTLEIVFQKFGELSRTGKPFGLFSLTLDTHPPSGHVTPACSGMKYGDGRNKMLNAVHCADYLAANFIRRVQTSPFAKDTVIVVGSDHFVMNSDATNQIQAPGGALSRSNLLLVFDDDQPPRVVSRVGTTLDIAPTLLDILGYRADEFAMGRNLLGKAPTMAEKLGFDAFASKVERWRTDLWRYWNPPRDSQAGKKETVKMGTP